MLKKTTIIYKKKNTKSLKQWAIVTYQPKTFENPNIVDKNKLLQNIQKLCINYPRLYDKLKKYVLIALYIVIQKK